MINSEVLDTMQGRLGKRTSSGIRLDCLRELNLAIRELERGAEKPWFLESSTTGTLIAEQDYIDLPTNFLIEIEKGTFEIQNSDGKWVEMKKTSREKIREVTANVDPAFPEAYAIWGNRFILGPSPDAAYSYRFDDYVRTSPLVDNSTEVSNSWLTEFFDFTVYKALIVVARDHIQSDRVARNCEGAFERAKDAFMRECTARQVANETYLLTDEEE